jgi:uncharacterized membrane protein
MEAALLVFSKGVVTSLHALAVLVIVVGTVQSLFIGFQALRNPSPSGVHFRNAYLSYARWLIGALTFQLAADIVQTAITPVWNWNEIGHLAAIAVIRTFLNFFLERDVAEMERHHPLYAHDPARAAAQHTDRA